jgi:hypothetical protein
VIYFIKETVTQAIKIGFSTKPKRRLSGLQTANPYKLILLGTVSGNTDDETSFHGRFAKFRLEGEWFKGDIIEEVLSIIAAHKEQKEQARQLRRKTMLENTVTDENQKTETPTPPVLVGNERGIVDTDSGIQGISRIPGLRIKSFSLKLTERPHGQGANQVICGVEMRYVLEFEDAVTNDFAAQRPDLQKLQQAFLTANRSPGLKHVFLDEENAVIPFAPQPQDHHIVGGQEAITGEQGVAFRVLVPYERLLDPNYYDAKIKDVFIGKNYTGEHPLKRAKKLVICMR